MKLQTAFERVFRQLIYSDAYRETQPTKPCYRYTHGDPFAVGCLILEHTYDSIVEAVPISILTSTSVIFSNQLSLQEKLRTSLRASSVLTDTRQDRDMIDLLQELQTISLHRPPAEWEKRLKSLAKQFELVMPARRYPKRK